MAREWISLYLKPEASKDGDGWKAELLTLRENILAWLEVNTKKSYRVKIISVNPMKQISLEEYENLHSLWLETSVFLQIKFRSPRDATLFKLFFGEYITSRTNGVLLSLIRRAMPNLIAQQIIGVSPMSAPTGLIFAMTSANRRAPPAAKPPPVTKKNIMQKLLQNTMKELQKR